MKWNNKTIYISLFSVLYFVVAAVSAVHAVSFFGLANTFWLGVILAIAFEIGQAAVLFSILTSPRERSKVMPWVLMCMFTLVQVLGNVYSSYKYVVNNSMADLRYFKEPIFIWTEIPDNMANVIIVYLVGAILPISALLLTSMVTNYLQDDLNDKKLVEETKVEEHVEPEPQVVEQKVEEIVETEQPEVEHKVEEIVETEQPEVEQKVEETVETEQPETGAKEFRKQIIEDKPSPVSDELNVVEKPTLKSHFVNV